MKDTMINVSLETSTAPVISEVRGRDWISYGDANGEWTNLYPQFLIDLYYSSSISAAIINATAEMISAEDLVIEDEDDRDIEARVKLQNFMNRANGSESLHEVIKKVAFDFKLQGGFALNLVWAKDRSKGIAEIYHIPVEKIRCARADEFGKTPGFYVSNDWANTRTNKPYYVPAFNANDRTSPNQILYSGLYSPNMDAYFTPDYVSCNNWALIDSKVSEFHLNNISNSFSGSYLFSFNNGTPTAEERNQIEQSIKDKFTGEKAAGRFVLCFSDDRNRAPEITPLNTADLDKQYLALQELLTANICSGHRITSKTLVGIDSTNGFSSNTDELINAANFYLNTVIKPFQDQIVKVLRKLFKINNMDMPVQFVQLKPITVQFDSKTVREVMTQNEIRESLGLPPLDDNDVVVEDKEEFSKVGMIDGKPVFSTIEEAEAHSKVLGCEGYHEHEYDGKMAYMACEGHAEATELSKFIEEFGEDIPEGWDLIDDEIVDGEHEDFDFEKELNKIASEKLEFVSTGRATPNTRSKQDGLNKKGNVFFKVRYVYTKNKSLSQKGETRSFCKLMMASKKVYRKENILKMTNMAVNPGWGPRGANTYSIFLWKGGGNCHHYWKRRIYQAPASDEGFVVYPDNITTDKIVGIGKAKSMGFVEKDKNDSKVARAPKTLPNEGFLK